MKYLAFLLALFFSISGFAGVYKCTGHKGKTSYQTTPCPNQVGVDEINLLTGSHKNLFTEEIKKEREKQQIQEEQEKLVLEEKLAKEKEQKFKQKALAESNKNQQIIRENPGKFSAYAIPPYLEGNRPALVENFASRIVEIEQYRRKAAFKALKAGQCDRVEASELNLKSTIKELIFLIDCTNGSRVYLSEKDL